MTPIALLVAYAAGVALVRFVAPLDLAGFTATTVFLVGLWACLRRSVWAWVPFLGLLLVSGFLQASLQLEPPSTANHISRFSGTSPLLLEGMVITAEKMSAGGYRLLAEAKQVFENRTAASVSGRVLVSIKEGALKVRPGQIIRWRSALCRPSSFGNLGEFDYPLYLAARGIHATAFINDAEDLVVLANHPGQQNEYLENFRLSLAARIEQAVPEDAVGPIQSLLLGMRGGISDEQRQVLSESGVAHLFAISGLHFGLLAVLLYQISKWLYTRSQRLILWCPPQRILPVFLTLPLAAYLVLTGNAWATQRAFLMVSAVALLFASGRRTPSFTLLATVAFCLLLFNPLALFLPGFQLSFAGVAGILIWLPCWQRPFLRLSSRVRWVLTLLLTTAAATLATAPATLWHFHQFAPAGLLTNLIAIPLIAWGAVPLGLASMAVLPFSALLTDVGLQLSAKLVTFTISTVSVISRWPGQTAIQLYLTSSNLILMVGIILVFLPFGISTRHWFCRLAILLTAMGTAWLTQPHVADFQVTVFSVGQGDATMISLADNAHYLIDGGGLPGSSIDPGERLVAPALGRMGIDHLQGVILSHNHPDHSSGLTYILRRFPVDHFYFAGEFASLPPELREVLQQREIAVHRLKEGWFHLQKNSDQSISLFVPSQNTQDVNERSIAVFAGSQSEGVLLTADLGRKGLRQLFNATLPGRASLLKLPHHGSRNNQPELCLDRTLPTAAFVSSGRGNPYGFPHQQVIEACSARQIPLFRTDLEGMLTFHYENGSWQSRTGKALQLTHFMEFASLIIH